MLGVKEIDLGQGGNKFFLSRRFRDAYFDRAPIIRPTAFGDEWAIVSEKATPPQWGKIALTFLGGLVLWFMHSNGGTNNAEQHRPIIVIFGLLFILWNSGSFILDIYRYRQSKRFGSPILLLEHDQFLPGDALTLGFHRDMLPGMQAPAGGSLSAWLVGAELTRREVGTDTTLDRVIFHEQELGKKLLVPGSNELRASWHLELPDNARPTLLQDGHWVVWLVQVRQSLPGQLEEATDFFIPVTLRRQQGNR